MRKWSIPALLVFTAVAVAQSPDIPPSEAIPDTPDVDVEPTQSVEVEAAEAVVMSAAVVSPAAIEPQSAPATISPGDEPTPRAPILDTAARAFSFQARFTDGSGDPIADGAHTLDFFFYDSAVGGALQGSVVNVAVTSTDGVVSTTFTPSTAIFNGAARYLGITIDDVDNNPIGDELSPRTQLTAVPYAFRVDRVASEELDDSIELGTIDADGRLDVFNAAADNAGISLFGINSQISTYGADGLEQIRLWGVGYGELVLHDGGVGNDVTALLTATSNAGGQLRLSNTDGETRTNMTSPDAGGVLTLYDSTPSSSVQLDGATGRVDAEDGYYLGPNVGGFISGQFRHLTQGSQISMYDETQTQTALIGASAVSGGFAQLYQTNGNVTVILDGDGSNNNGGGLITMRNGSNLNTVILDADASDGSASLSLYDSGTIQTVNLDANSGGGGSALVMSNSNAKNTVALDADESDNATLRLYADDVVNPTIDMTSSEGGVGGQIIIRNESGQTTIELDGDWAGTGVGRARADVVEILGGSDLSEQFDVRGDAKPGMVVSIDPSNPGRLSVCESANDTRVAGIISGARSIRPGLLMGQQGSRANGDTPIALTGRVWCYADSSAGAIAPGDFLTTSAVAGHCKKVTDHDAARGAIIGKAMTGIEDGMVLVLVNLQ